MINQIQKVFKSNIGSKRIFQIAHLLQEVHNIQTYSAFDKKSWLQEAEAARSRYCSMFYNIEMSYIKLKVSRFKFSLPINSIASAGSISGSQGGFKGLFGAKTKKVKPEQDETDEGIDGLKHSQTIHRTKSKSEQPANSRFSNMSYKTSSLLRTGKSKKEKSQNHLDLVPDSDITDEQDELVEKLPAKNEKVEATISIQEEGTSPTLSDIQRLSKNSRKIAAAELLEAKAKLSPSSSGPGSINESASQVKPERSNIKPNS